MSVYAIARPYAKALFMLAQEQNEVETWSHWLSFVAKVGQHPLIVEMLKNPIYTQQFRLDFFKGLIKEMMGDSPVLEKGVTFLETLTDQNRMILLPEIQEAFETIRRAAERSTKVEVTSAKKLTADEQGRLITALGKRFSTSIELIEKEDPSLLAGAVIRAEDIVLDGSVLGKIRQLREALA